ncbi:MAG: hypothetical protein AMJ92_07375 [candidate division Zixibacteria bacterium SM23_81]|nr:MAG: hypothetical protein AMJ92_07375 [candidate division Zixibacteria bacterium SM23_81]
MRNIKLTLEYDGTDFYGWQVQPEGRTVQGVLEKSLGDLLQESVRIIGAGRTDAGVHAKGQVANFATESELLLNEIYRGLNALLPSDVVVRCAEEVSVKFHARYDATSRRYLYRISSQPTALRRNFVWTILSALDLGLMRKAAQALMGTHDFASFCLGSEERPNYRCTVQQISLKSIEDEAHFQIAADRFLRAMVRIIVGQLVEVGRGRLTLGEFLEFLQKGGNQPSAMAAPPQGLCLMEVQYLHSARLAKGESR